MNRTVPRKRVSTLAFSLQSPSLPLVLLFVAAVTQALAVGIPEPGVILYGRITDEGGALVTGGRLVWTYTSQGGAATVRVQVAADLNPFVDEADTTYSYRVLIPAEMPVAGMPVSADRLPVVAGGLTFMRDAVLDGAILSIAGPATDVVTFSSAERGTAERVDLVIGADRPPEAPCCVAPTEGELLVPLDCALDWTDCARAESYDVYLWQAAYIQPSVPTVTGLTGSQFQPPATLRPDTDYCWQVVACNSQGETAGPVWMFRTAFAGDLQRLLDFLLGKCSLTFAEQSALDLNGDGVLDVADMVLGLKRTVYATPKPGTPVPPEESEPRKAAWTGQETVAVGSTTLRNYQTVEISLPVNVSPATNTVAGVNLHLEADPGVLEFAGATPASQNDDEDLYFHCPHKGVMNVVFFANPVDTLRCPSARVLDLDLRVLTFRGWNETEIQLTVAALSDVAGLSAPGVKRQNGVVRLQLLSSSHRWQLYR